MSEGKLLLIPAIGPVVEIPASEYGELLYSCPCFNFMAQKLEVSHVEHVSVLFNNKHCHMFVDEVGLIRGLPVNPRATRIYYNNTFKREGLATLVYEDLAANPQLPVGSHAQITGLITNLIVGPALLWTGDME